jgi:hypothetical protein
MDLGVNWTDPPNATDVYFSSLPVEHEHRVRMREMHCRVAQDLGMFHYPLHILVKQDSLPLLQSFLRFAEKIDWRIREAYTKRTALHIAAEKCSPEVRSSTFVASKRQFFVCLFEDPSPSVRRCWTSRGESVGLEWTHAVGHGLEVIEQFGLSIWISRRDVEINVESSMPILVDSFVNGILRQFSFGFSTIRIELLDCHRLSSSLVVSRTVGKQQNSSRSNLDLVQSKLSRNTHGRRRIRSTLHRWHKIRPIECHCTLFLLLGSILRNLIHVMYENEQLTLTNHELVELFTEDLGSHFDKATDEIDTITTILSTPLKLKQISRNRIRKRLCSSTCGGLNQQTLEHPSLSSTLNDKLRHFILP